MQLLLQNSVFICYGDSMTTNPLIFVSFFSIYGLFNSEENSRLSDMEKSILRLGFASYFHTRLLGHQKHLTNA